MEKAVFGIGQIPCDLLHPTLVRICGATGEVDAASFQLHDEQQVDGPATNLLRPATNMVGIEREVRCGLLGPRSLLGTAFAAGGATVRISSNWGTSQVKGLGVSGTRSLTSGECPFLYAPDYAGRKYPWETTNKTT